MIKYAGLSILIGAVLLTSIAIVVARHQSRKQFIELQILQHQRDVMNDEWRQLLLEQATWGAPGRVESMARQKLGMKVPSPDTMSTVER